MDTGLLVTYILLAPHTGQEPNNRGMGSKIRQFATL